MIDRIKMKGCHTEMMWGGIHYVHSGQVITTLKSIDLAHFGNITIFYNKDKQHS